MKETLSYEPTGNHVVYNSDPDSSVLTEETVFLYLAKK